ncbi:hypothetical protein CKO50_18425 [Pseudoalteromonas sp. HM-SA03]|uniref:hypothetical protein n=1 Tax=Pseudoalteromonas sp. HM-SA03 TaxID=2029678 RepID=UPI000BADE5F2|nr:hypothetical protein [Pseudoalteromonas sp. HM-SA03]PAY00025.1 hypothetical protein CKO50_18425 [Pseudoalteromonas sp. HM-SA03]
MNTLQKNSFFNRFFRENSFKGGLSKNRHGLAVYRRFYTPKLDLYLNTSERYYYAEKPGSTTFFLFYLPCGISFAIWVLLLLNFLVVIFTDEGFYWPILFIIPIYSFIMVNFLGLTYDRVRFKGAYFDRKDQKVSFTWKIENASEFDRFGNPTFDWKDIECHTKNEFATLGIMKGFIEIRHKDLELYPNAKLTINASGDTSKPVRCFLEWEAIVRHMQQDKPLPDTPEYELYRELDPLTKSFDKSNGRPKGFWTQFSLEQQREIEEKIFQEAIKFDWSEGKVQPEITKPWEVWTPDPTRPPKPRGMFTMIMLQLVFCYPE